MNKIFLKFTGHSNNHTEPKGRQFVLKITNEEYNRINQFPFPARMEAEVVDGKGLHPNGQIKEFINPFYEFHKYMVPTFVKISELIENLEEKSLTQ